MIATVEALNVVGYSMPSITNTVGASVRTEPHMPSLGPQRNDAGTTDTQIKVDFANLVDPDNGGSTVLSLNLQWDKGTGVWVSLIGEASNSMATSFTVTGLTPG